MVALSCPSFWGEFLYPNVEGAEGSCRSMDNLSCRRQKNLMKEPGAVRFLLWRLLTINSSKGQTTLS